MTKHRKILKIQIKENQHKTPHKQSSGVLEILNVHKELLVALYHRHFLIYYVLGQGLASYVNPWAKHILPPVYVWPIR